MPNVDEEKRKDVFWIQDKERKEWKTALIQHLAVDSWVAPEYMHLNDIPWFSEVLKFLDLPS